MKDEAIHKALKVLNCLNNDRVYETVWVKDAINACEEALQQPTQEPVAWMYYDKVTTSKEKAEIYVENPIPLYTHPHQWVGLTDDEIAYIVNDTDTLFELEDFARAIEAKLKERNHVN